MSGNGSKAADPERRASMRTSMRLSRVEGDDDEYDAEAMGISDGFRPADVAANHANPMVSPRLSRVEGPDEPDYDDDDDDLAAMGISDGFRPADVAQNHANPTRTSMRLSHEVGDGDGHGHYDDGNDNDHVYDYDDDDDDDYAMAAMGISDGFRPADVTQTHANPTTAGPDPSAKPTENATTLPQSLPARPLSITKPPPGQRESLTLRHDGGMGPLNDSAPPRGSTSSGAASLARPESPYQGPSGPSFPYEMYSQNTRAARTASVTTTSTAPVVADRQSYQGPRGPTHPYQLYPQNTVPEVEADQITPAPIIPVGFPGTTDNYQRRIGPEGEEAGDMIGPDGHTEQLPPYTRYPEEAYARKAHGIVLPVAAPAAVAAAAVPAAPDAVPAQTQAHNIPGAGGIGLATRDPEFASSEDLNAAGATNSAAQSRQSVRSFQTENSQNEINSAAALPTVNEKKPLKKWQVIAKRKVWGVVPCWAIGLTTSILVMLAAVLGAVLGTFFGAHHPGHHTGKQPSMTYDATPLPTVPAGLPPLAEGKYAMPIMLTSDPKICFNDTTQAQAWNCNLIKSQLEMEVTSDPTQPSTAMYSLSISYNASYSIQNNVYSYGEQPPSVNKAQLILVNDTYEQDRGPAWALQMVYNKTVIIPEALFTSAASEATTSDADQSINGRDAEPALYGFDYQRKGVAQEGDKPWICHWDGTILEAFIYAGQNSSSNPIIITGGSSSTTTTSATSTATEFPYSSYLPTTNPLTQVRKQATPTTTATPVTSASASSTNYFDTSQPTDYASAYPRVVKVEERRVPGYPSVQPWCRQYQIVGSGKPAQPVKDESGHYIDIMIAEDEAEYGTTSEKLLRKSLLERYLSVPVQQRDAGSDMSDCGCKWYLT